MQRFFPACVFRTLSIPIVFALAFGCSSHLTTIPAPPHLQADPSGVSAVASVAYNTTSGQSALHRTAASPPVVVPNRVAPVVVQQDAGATVIGDWGLPLSPHESLAIVDPSETSRQVQVVVGRIVDAVLRLNGTAWLSLAAIAAMVILYGLEDRSPFFTLAFAVACWSGSACGALQNSWLIESVGGIWGCLALRKWWRRIQSRKANEDRVVIWPVRFIGALAVVSGVFLLIVDSPLSAQLPVPVSRAVAEAMPLLLVGIAYLAWLSIDRPPIIDLIKQIFIAMAFILWGINLLMPPGPWAKLVGAVVISIYVFDLAWLMEGNLRKKFGVRSMADATSRRAQECQSSGVCSCDGPPENPQSNGRKRRAEVPANFTEK